MLDIFRSTVHLNLKEYRLLHSDIYVSNTGLILKKNCTCMRLAELEAWLLNVIRLDRVGACRMSACFVGTVGVTALSMHAFTAYCEVQSL